VVGVPTVKTIKKRLRWLDKTELGDRAATICRQAMEWAEGEDPKPTLQQFFEDSFSPGEVGIPYYLDDFDYRDDRIHRALLIMDAALETFGVEYIASSEDTFSRAEGLKYLNTGDMDTPTIIYDRGKGRWEVLPWGNIVEYEWKRFGGGEEY
jgi:hypothetical protein